MVIGINTVSSQSGRAYCADFLSRKYSIQGYAHESSNGSQFVRSINSLGGIFLDRPANNNNEKKTFFNIEPGIISHDLGRLLERSDYIILSEPSHYFVSSIKEMIAEGMDVKKRVPIILSPSRSFASPYLWKILGESYPIVSFSTCPYSCKAPRPDTAYIKRRKRNWQASLEGAFSISQIADLGQLFPQAIFNKMPMTTSIGNIGAVLHPTTYLLNFERIRSREKGNKPFSFYMEGIYEKPDVGEVLEAIDQMRLQIANKMGFSVFGLRENPRESEWKKIMSAIRTNEAIGETIDDVRRIRREGLKELRHSITSCQHWLDYTYGVERKIGESLSEAIGRTGTYQKNSIPQLRYVIEDVATGLVPLTMMARRMGFDTSVADDILQICERFFPDRDKSNDRTLEEFSDEYLSDYLCGTFFSITD